jgi:aldehyde dehydrogenase (NAD+)
MSKQNNHWKNFISGQWVDSVETLAIENPATGKVFATIASASLNDVEAAVNAARSCVNQGLLSNCRPAERTALLLRIADEIRAIADRAAELLVFENGKRLKDAKDELTEAARYFEYYAGMADKIEGASIPLGPDYVDYTVYEPQGISVQVVPWNFPVSICARSLAPALAAGNAVIVKSPELTPLTMTWLATACQRAGLPAGALSILCGDGPTIGGALVAHADINQIVFTGSVPTGRSILHAAAERAVPSVMELGGKSAAVVFADADLDQLIDSVYWGIFFNAGQVCSAMSRLLVHRSIYEQVIERVRDLALGLTLGPGMDNCDLTPLASATQQRQVLERCNQAIAQGARLVVGGAIPQPMAGYFFEPTVFCDVSSDMDLFQQEIFGPVIAITPFDTEQQAWELANSTDYGLVAGIFSKDINHCLRGIRALKAGQVFVNEWYAGGIETPFGGTGLSGFGREKGQEALYNYVRSKNIAIRVAASSA